MTIEAVQMVQAVVGGLGLFLLGMKLMSDGMEALAGNRLNRLICAVTNNRVMAILVGVGVTCVIQSSSAVTVMVVGFVNSGVMTLMQAIGVIFGANIGTTLSLWILTLNISAYGPLFIGASAFVYLFARKERTRFIGMAILGLGMLFFGMELMSDGFKPLRGNEGFRTALAMFDATTLYGFTMAVVVSTIITGIVQSSAAVIVITMSLATNGVVDFPTCVAVIMGSNIGTCGTAGLACIGTARNAVRAALAHALFNVIGVVVVVAIHGPFVKYSEIMARWISRNPDGPLNFVLAIACVHTVFNVLSTVVMYPLMGALERLVIFFLPIRKEETKSARFKAQFLDKNLLNQAPIAIAQAGKEILRMGETCVQMLDDLHAILSTAERNAYLEEGVFHAENNLDIAQKEIAEYVSGLLHGNVTHEVALLARRAIRQADEFESVSDHVRNALKAYLKIRNADETLTDAALAEVLDLCERDRAFCLETMDILRNGSKDLLPVAAERSKGIDALAKDYRDRHMQRLAVTCTAPVKSLVYSDMLVAFRRTNDHLLTIVETLQA